MPSIVLGQTQGRLKKKCLGNERIGCVTSRNGESEKVTCQHHAESGGMCPVKVSPLASPIPQSCCHVPTWYGSCPSPSCFTSQFSGPVTLKSLPRDSLLLHLQDSRAIGFLRRKRGCLGVDLQGKLATWPRQRHLPQGDEDQCAYLRHSCRP